MTEENQATNRQEIIDTIKELIAKYEAMPPQAMIAAANQYDMLTILYLLSAILDCSSES